jgi:PAS domain S-box-containing protein
MKNDPLGIRGIINKMEGMAKVFKDRSLADEQGIDPTDLTLDAINEYISLKLTDKKDVYLKCEEALNRIGSLDFSTQIEVDESDTVGNYVAHSINMLMSELEEKVFPFQMEIIDSISDLVIVSDFRGIIIKVNKSFMTLCGLTEKELKNKQVLDLFYPSAFELNLLTVGFALKDLDVNIKSEQNSIPVTLSVSEIKGFRNTTRGFIFIAQTKNLDKK